MTNQDFFNEQLVELLKQVSILMADESFEDWQQKEFIVEEINSFVEEVTATDEQD